MLVPYLTGGIGGLTMFSRGSVEQLLDGTTSNHTFFTGNLGGGVKWFATEHFGIRGDYRFLMVNSNSSSPAFFARDDSRFGHRIYGGIRDRELDIVLLSVKDGQIVRNLTAGFAQSHGFEHMTFPAAWNTVPWLSWSADGDRLAYFARRGKGRSLVLHDVVTGRIDRRSKGTATAPMSCR